MSGTATASGGRTTSLGTLTLSAGEYTFSRDTAIADVFLMSGSSAAFYLMGTTAMSQVVTLNADETLYIGVNVADGTTYDGTMTIQLENGSSATQIKKPSYISAVDLMLRDGFVTPEMYGAFGDGVHADGAAVQAALNSGKLVIGIGTYNVMTSEPYSTRFYLNVPDGAYLFGGTYKFPDNGYVSDYSTGQNMMNVGHTAIFENVTFDMNGSNNIPTPTKTMYTLYIDTCNGITVRNCKFKNSAGRNYIIVIRGNNFVLDNCSFHNIGTNLSGSDAAKQNDASYVFVSSDDSVVSNCVITADANPFAPCGGIEIHGNNSTCTGCVIHKCSPAIYIAKHQANNNTNKNISIINNMMIDCNDGVSLYLGHTYEDIIIDGNQIALTPIRSNTNPLSGIGFGDNNIKNLRVSHNNIRGTTTHQYGINGITIVSSNGLKICGNNISNVDQPILFKIGTTNTNNSDVQIENNNCITDAPAKKYIIDGVSGTTVDNLIVFDNLYRGYIGEIGPTLTATQINKLSEQSVNLLPMGTKTVTDFGVTSVYKHGKITLSGTSSGSGGRLAKRSPVFTLAAGTYHYSGNGIAGTIYIQRTADNGIVAQLSQSSTATSFTLDADTEVYIGITFSAFDYTGYSPTIQIEAGSTGTPVMQSGAMTAVDTIARSQN